MNIDYGSWLTIITHLLEAAPLTYNSIDISTAFVKEPFSKTPNRPLQSILTNTQQCT